MRVVVVILATTLVGCSKGTDSSGQARQTSVHALADQRARAADLWFQRLQDRRLANEPITAAFIDELLDAAAARTSARADALTSAGGKAAAHREHRDYCQELLRSLQDRTDAKVSQQVVARLRYEIADAEYRMARYEE